MNKDGRITPFVLTSDEKEDLFNFLISLTDTSYMEDYR